MSLFASVCQTEPSPQVKALLETFVVPELCTCSGSVSEPDWTLGALSLRCLNLAMADPDNWIRVDAPDALPDAPMGASLIGWPWGAVSGALVGCLTPLPTVLPVGNPLQLTGDVIGKTITHMALVILRYGVEIIRRRYSSYGLHNIYRSFKKESRQKNMIWDLFLKSQAEAETEKK
eukprot:5612848-Amphidinium_carterae.1